MKIDSELRHTLKLQIMKKRQFYTLSDNKSKEKKVMELDYKNTFNVTKANKKTYIKEPRTEKCAKRVRNNQDLHKENSVRVISVTDSLKSKLYPVIKEK